MGQMKIGRNSPCPCGSGKRYKKCHGERKFNDILKQQVDGVKQLAYAGNIGREREQFCIDMEAVMLELQKKAERQFHQDALDYRRHFQCAPRCSNCCGQFIGTTLHEGEVIVRYLYQHPELLDIFMEQAYKWRERTKGENSFIAADRLLSNAECFLPEREEYRRLGIPCPFLYDNLCIIYPVRPMTCVYIASFEHPDQCSSKSKSPPTYRFLYNSLPALSAILRRGQEHYHFFERAYFGR
ncbi:MAG: SEC-C metal-binding domain-containing protein [Syntrophorhabdales bacterium]|jgi:Fe-S-cluster containining protein